MKKNTLLLIFLLLSAAPVCAIAATTVRTEAPTGTITVGSVFPVRVLLNTDEPLNAYSITLNFQGPLNFLNANNANSIIRVWQSNPKMLPGNDVTIAGGSIAPFKGSGELLTLNFRAIAAGTARFTFPDARVYLADGKGTAVVPVSRPAQFSVLPGAPKTANGAPPGTGGIEFLTLIVDPLNASQKLLGFSVVDSGLGTKSVEMRYRTGIFWTPWGFIQNPAPVPRNAWQIDFRVVDNNGNVTEQFIYDWGVLEVPGIVFGLIIVGILVVVWEIIRKRGGGALGRNPKQML
ncbi:MAG: cohesin domain-containing protein [Minisyncoccia bacterium]|jgi:hypothetical protein